jgi:hypothetical protein
MYVKCNLTKEQVVRRHGMVQRAQDSDFANYSRPEGMADKLID